jgi:hypothetical protein
VSAAIRRVTVKAGNNCCGGGIVNQGTLVLKDSMLSHNNAISGGGLQNAPAPTQSRGRQSPPAPAAARRHLQQQHP